MFNHIFFLWIPEMLTERSSLLLLSLLRWLNNVGGPGRDPHLAVHQDLNLGPVGQSRLAVDSGKEQLPPSKILILKLVRTPESKSFFDAIVYLVLDLFQLLNSPMRCRDLAAGAHSVHTMSLLFRICAPNF